MSPGNSQDNATNVALAASVFYRKSILGHAAFVIGSNFNNLFSGKFGIWDILTVQTSKSAFSYLVGVILGKSSKKYVAWVAADWVVAFMASAKSIRNFAISFFPRKSMRHHGGVLVFEVSVVRMINKLFPRPARHGPSAFINVEPEILSNSWRSRIEAVQRSGIVVSAVMSLAQATAKMISVTSINDAYFHKMKVAHG